MDAKAALKENVVQRNLHGLFVELAGRRQHLRVT